MRAALISLLLVGCMGRVEQHAPLRPGPPTREGATRPQVCDPAARDVAGPRLLRRLSREELDASLRATFELDDSWGGPIVPPDPASADGFTNHADLLRVNEAYATQLRETAEQIGEVVGAREACADPSCVDAFLDTVGRRAFRRPLSADERARYHALAAEAGPDALRWVSAALAQSPSFLYRSELGTVDASNARLDGYELATAMAFSLTGGPPDDALLDRAHELEDEEARRVIARALAFDADGRPRPAFRAQVMRFARGWLGLASLDNLGKSPERFPTWTPEVRAALGDEVDRFLQRVLLDERGSVRDLLTSRTTELDPVLASYYGWGAPGPVERPLGWGAGVLALGGVLAIGATNVATSPTQRGYFVRTRVLCGTIDPPPPDIPSIPEPTAAETTRQRYERLHAGDTFCQGCHRLMDPIGFGFEHLDAAGRFRELDNGFPIDDSGAIYDPDPALEALEFEGPEVLAELLADDPEAARCVGSFAASHVHGLSRHDTECLASSALEGLSEDQPLIELYVELVGTRHFGLRAL